MTSNTIPTISTIDLDTVTGGAMCRSIGTAANPEWALGGPKLKTIDSDGKLAAMRFSSRQACRDASSDL